MNKKIIGNWGEKLAQNYLKNKGYIILETNWHYKHKEMDIIAYQGQIIGIEVKTRTRNNPVFTILKTEQVARLRLVLQAYCELNHLDYEKSRLDLITLKINNQNTVNLKHQLDI